MSLFDSNVDVDTSEDDEDEDTATSVDEKGETAATNQDQSSSATSDNEDVPTEEAVKRSRDAPKEGAIEQARGATRDRPGFESGENVLDQYTPEEPTDLKESHPDLRRRGYLGPELRKGISEAAKDPDSPLHDEDIIDDAARRLAAADKRLETIVEENEHARLLARARPDSRKLWAIPAREMKTVADPKMYARERRAVRVAHEHAARVALEKVRDDKWIGVTPIDVQELDTLVDAQGWALLLKY